MRLFKRNKPWVTLQYEEQFIPENYSEQGVDTGAKLEDELIGNVDVQHIHAATKDLSVEETNAWLEEHLHEFDPNTW